MSNTVSGIAMLAAPSNRSRIYLDVLERANLLPERVVVLDDPSVQTAEQRRREAESGEMLLPEDPALDSSRTVQSRLEANGIPYEAVQTLNSNDQPVRDAVARLDQEYLIYSGPGGVILDGALLTAGPQFIHVHAGTLPEYRGSTTAYYSLIEDGTCGATAFIMTETLDNGPIVARETFPAPDDPETVDLYYDPWIRGQTLIQTVQQYKTQGALSTETQDDQAGETYFIIHPVLKHIAIESVKQSD